MVGDLFIRHSLYQRDDHILLTIRQGIRVLTCRSLEHHIRDVACHIALFRMLFQTSDGRHEDMVLHHRMLTQPHLILVDVVKRGGELVVVQPVLGQILNNKEFQFTQLLVGSPMMLREGIHIIVVGGLPVYQRLHIREQCLLLIFHVTAYLVGIFIVEAQDQLGKRLTFVQGFL